MADPTRTCRSRAVGRRAARDFFRRCLKTLQTRHTEVKALHGAASGEGDLAGAVNHGRGDLLDKSMGNGVTGGDRGKVVFSVNDRQLELAEPVVDGGRILEEAGFRPAEDYVLIQLLLPGTRSVGLDESVELRGDGSEAFRAFKSDRIFRFTIDDRGYEWGVAKITEPELRRIAVVAGDRTLVQERDGKVIELAPGDIVELGQTGTERLRVVELVTVSLNNEVEKKIPSGAYQTEQLIRVLGVEAGYVLDVLDEQGKLDALQPGQTIQVKAGMKFFSHVPAGGSA